jgi:hypothetical protein
LDGSLKPHIEKDLKKHTIGLAKWLRGTSMVEFSVVVPISEKDVSIVPRTIGSWFSLASDDFLLCVDKPISNRLKNVIQKGVKICGVEEKVRIIEVERSGEWRFHQAHVRREGFHKAKYDRILTGDIDLIVNKNVYKAVELVGKDNIGLVSLSKFHYPKHLSDYWRESILIFSRNILHGLMDKIMMTTTFSGLYALYRPYWLETEPEEEIKRLVNPKQFHRGENPDISRISAMTGEDTFLKDCMIKKYRCVYLRDIGAIDLRTPLEYVPSIQYSIGRYFAQQGRSTIVSIGRAVLRAQPYYLTGFLEAKRRKSSYGGITGKN